METVAMISSIRNQHQSRLRVLGHILRCEFWEINWGGNDENERNANPTC